MQDDFDFGDMLSPFGHEQSEEGKSVKEDGKYDPILQNMGNLQDEARPVEVPNDKPGLSWSMFEKVKELGVGSFGVVYLVKCN